MSKPRGCAPVKDGSRNTKPRFRIDAVVTDRPIVFFEEEEEEEEEGANTHIPQLGTMPGAGD